MITKVSEITSKEIADYVRLAEPSNEEMKYLETILNVAKDFIKNYTGYDNLDKFSSFVIVVYVLCQDMYDNRSYYVDNTNVNKVVQTILDMHSVDLL